jgi:hypothetical protein
MTKSHSPLPIGCHCTCVDAKGRSDVSTTRGKRDVLCLIRSAGKKGARCNSDKSGAWR